MRHYFAYKDNSYSITATIRKGISYLIISNTVFRNKFGELFIIIRRVEHVNFIMWFFFLVLWCLYPLVMLHSDRRAKNQQMIASIT